MITLIGYIFKKIIIGKEKLSVGMINICLGFCYEKKLKLNL